MGNYLAELGTFPVYQYQLTFEGSHSYLNKSGDPSKKIFMQNESYKIETCPNLECFEIIIAINQTR